jgi:hypothetical protein
LDDWPILLALFSNGCDLLQWSHGADFTAWNAPTSGVPRPQSRLIELLLRAENRILRHLEDAELNHGFGGSFDLLLRLWIKTRARFPLLFYELPKSRHDEFTVLFGGFVGDGAERIKEYTGVLFIGLRGCGK